ncbi:MotA/TolQ/ExbB proton channel family protein [Allorhodopirellula solitaria]|uniref:Colicin uptake protein TolQ n=1 Tax=Allorhodopirellula solitaria TaxID=2527987 RepID=A0A5C5YHJ6_9BACT|nr:MotA/TolQ/ExbB proton channel family protein [Allorhodopirellula solitaria]TWT74261.1 colicin uptake protein TolQ [Allorhodopirellula solitaria]
MRFSPLNDSPVRRFSVARGWTHVLTLAWVGWIVAASSLPLLHLTTASAQSASVENGPEMIDSAEIESIINEVPEPVAGDGEGPSGIDLYSLISRGGWFMAPIGLMSMLVVTLAVERTLSLRTSKIIPKSMSRQLADLALTPDQFSPPVAWGICHQNRSPAARVVMSMLMRTGQPLGDIERTANETIQREADRYAAPVRWLTLAAAATPLMGLLGTVWGMIVAFHESSNLTADRSRSEQLSEGIYTALVTTLAGLIVAIPAAILAQYLENRIVKLFHRIEELAFGIAPGLARFTGRSRLDYDGHLRAIEGAPPPVQSNEPAQQKSRGRGNIPTPPPVASPS